MKVILNKKISVTFVSLLNNPERLLEKNIVWEDLSANEKVVDSLKELFLAGCKVIIKTDLDRQKVIEFLEKIDLFDFAVLED